MLKRGGWTFLAALCGVAQAHPVDELLQEAYLTLTPGAIRLELDLAPGSQVAGAVVRAIDADADGQLSAAEARTFAGRVLAQSSVTVGGKAMPWTLNQVIMPPYQHLLSGNGVVKIYAVTTRPDRAGADTVAYQNRYQPVKSRWMANIFLLPGADWWYQVSRQQHSSDGQGLTVTYQVARR
ncbi:hypothetical protein ACFP9V_22830 [Deinococcus radiopugnans]|uniref:Uncharacterized protein n=1 Tax=Deinococcus radiopugnans ATCC 19172 TaxID=585398 RepID=A0A5C4Y6V3_9DEIO|nr:hypothetical protein [Deinococcus radiopugnans]MBB6017093.1 hypothetical protein [Deinococcus radiopugnans ATCC 19172]TNM70676.1 hypothetical protein FHR04_12300 [Deinococcus radiopugnans ATCC 19172]